MKSLMQTLKQETWPWHQRLDRRLNLLDPRFSGADYLRLIVDFLGFYRPLEIQLSSLADLQTWIPDLEQRAKTKLLAADLLVLGFPGETISQIEHCNKLPELNDLPSALGCLYVLEGATLGGQFICRHMSNSLGICPSSGGAFFYGYGKEADAMWQGFGERLAAAVNALGPVEASVVHSACATFASLESWLCREEQDRG